MDEEFMACGLYPLLASFGLGEVVDRETPVSKLCLLLPKFPIVRLPDETNDHFYARVELAMENVIRGYAHEEHDVCVTSGGRVNRVFEQAGVAHAPHSEPGFEVSKEAARKRRDDVGAGPGGKRVKVSSLKAATPKASVVLKSTDAASSKVAPSKTISSRAILMKADAAPKIGAPTKAGAPMRAAVQKSTVNPSRPKDGALKICTG
jgi:hypothetical protein